MKEVIDLYKNVVIQIATPYSTGGTGFYLKECNLIVTNEHVVRGNREVVIEGDLIKKQLSRVLYVDPLYDLAFLEISENNMPEVNLNEEDELQEGEQIIAVGHPFRLKFTATSGIISNTNHLKDEISYIQHDAALNPGNSGGPLVNNDGKVIGVNTFIIRDGQNIGFSLPISYLKNTLEEYLKSNKQIGARCSACSNLIFEKTIDNGYCPHCGAKAQIPSEIEVYSSIGIPRTIESLLEKTGHNIQLSRSGPNNWEIQHGSAKVNISYYEKSGLIIGDAYLCHLPKNNIKSLYEYLLKQNYEIEGLTFSIKGQDIVLSLLIYDRYLNEDTGMKLIKHLFDRADYYDNILVEEYGAHWKNDDN